MSRYVEMGFIKGVNNTDLSTRETHLRVWVWASLRELGYPSQDLGKFRS